MTVKPTGVIQAIIQATPGQMAIMLGFFWGTICLVTTGFQGMAVAESLRLAGFVVSVSLVVVGLAMGFYRKKMEVEVAMKKALFADTGPISESQKEFSAKVDSAGMDVEAIAVMDYGPDRDLDKETLIKKLLVCRARLGVRQGLLTEKEGKYFPIVDETLFGVQM